MEYAVDEVNKELVFPFLLYKSWAKGFASYWEM